MGKKEVIQIRVDAKTKNQWLALARHLGIDLSTLIRQAVEKFRPDSLPRIAK